MGPPPVSAARSGWGLGSGRASEGTPITPRKMELVIALSEGEDAARAELWARYPQDDVSAGIRRMTVKAA